MDSATIGDDIQPIYEFEWSDGLVRTSDEIGDIEAAYENATLDDVVDVGRDDPDCTVRVIGFGAV